MKRFGSDQMFKTIVNPNTQVDFGSNPQQAIMGDYPTLIDIDAAYGKGFAVEWMIPHIDNLSSFSGGKNVTEEQQLELSRIIATEFRYLKVTELLLFFYRFKTGRYGRFYGSVDPLSVTCALRDFIKERNLFIDQTERIK